MPHFYLHLGNGQGYLEDDHGDDYADVNAARQDAICSLREAIAADILKGVLNIATFIEIEDAQHQHVATMHFADAVRVETRADGIPTDRS
jgi:hypothetical protein